MKKLLLAAVSALMLVGCSSSSSSGTIDTKVSDDQTVITVDGVKITKQDLFEEFLKDYGANQILNEAIQQIATYEITDTTKIDAEIQSTIDSYLVYFGTEEDLEDYVVEQGYESLDDYKEKVIKPNALQNALMEQYIDENYETLCTEYGFVYIRYFTVSLESDAMSIISDIDDGTTTFEDAATANAGSVPEQVLISTLYTGSDVDSAIYGMSTTFTKEGMYSLPITCADSDSTYAVVQVISTDMTNSADDVKSQLESDDDFVTNTEAYYLKKYNFTVYESTLKDDINAISEAYLSTTDDSSDAED